MARKIAAIGLLVGTTMIMLFMATRDPLFQAVWAEHLRQTMAERVADELYPGTGTRGKVFRSIIQVHNEEIPLRLADANLVTVKLVTQYGFELPSQRGRFVEWVGFYGDPRRMVELELRQTTHLVAATYPTSLFQQVLGEEFPRKVAELTQHSMESKLQVLGFPGKIHVFQTSVMKD